MPSGMNSKLLQRVFMTATKDASTMPTKASHQEKAATTDKAAWHIIESEAKARDKKTEKLREMRLQQAARASDTPATPAVAKKKKK
jgi:hypothetical protein